MHPLLICHAPTLTHACPHYLYGAPQLLPCVLPHCRPRRVASRTFSAAFPGKAALIRKKVCADERRKKHSPRGGPKKRRFFCGVFLRLNKTSFMFSITPQRSLEDSTDKSDNRSSDRSYQLSPLVFNGPGRNIIASSVPCIP